MPFCWFCREAAQIGLDNQTAPSVTVSTQTLGLHCLPFQLNVLDEVLYGKPTLSNIYEG